ncbi:MAG: dephospho-CoA kinase [Candidatus Omnitrophica bacterium]|nr:dephospho-CoA kinase [Candidatus Omnitrophota bacterium]
MKTIVGLTGCFGSGKTTVAGFFKNMGAYVIDADSLVHEIYSQDVRIKRKIIAQFGKCVSAPRDRIDRKKLGEAAFKSRKALRKLCRIIHPEVIRRIRSLTGKTKREIVVIDAPLLLEAGLVGAVDLVITVKASRKKSIERCLNKGFGRMDILRRLSFQIPMRKKIALADFVIDNNYSKEESRKKTAIIWQELRRKKNGKGCT